MKDMWSAGKKRPCGNEKARRRDSWTSMKGSLKKKAANDTRPVTFN